MESRKSTIASAYKLAKTFIDNGKINNFPTIWYIAGEWQIWSGIDYQSASTVSVEHQVLEFLRKRSCGISRSLIKNIVDLIRSIQNIEVAQLPCWLNGSTEPTNYFAVKNGLLSGLRVNVRLQPHDPTLFGMRSVGYEFDPNATCPRWQQFLGELWPQDSASRQLLQEWFGYCLLDDTSQQKIFSIIGPPRSGKSTIARVLTSLLNSQNVASPSIRDLSSSFGLWGLLGKKLAIIPDAVLPHPSPSLEEVLKCISGEDSVDVNRKGLPPLSGVKLKCRLMVLANERPVYRDPSGALDRRTIELRTNRSFFGAENTQLTNCLLSELPGILNWAIKGLQELTERGRFLDERESRQAEAASTASSETFQIATKCNCGRQMSIAITLG